MTGIFKVSYQLVYVQTMINEPFSQENYPRSGVSLATGQDSGKL